MSSRFCPHAQAADAMAAYLGSADGMEAAC